MSVHKAIYRGFTLIELVVVTTVIAILSIVVIGGYRTIMESYRLGLLTDDFVTMVNEQKRITVSKGDAECLGLLFNEQGVAAVKAPYINNLVGCDDFAKTDINFFEDDLILKKAQLAGEEINDFVFYFSPPRGEVFLPKRAELLVRDEAVLQIDLALREQGKVKSIFLNLLTGQALVSDPRNNE